MTDHGCTKKVQRLTSVEFFILFKSKECTTVLLHSDRFAGFGTALEEMFRGLGLRNLF